MKNATVWGLLALLFACGGGSTDKTTVHLPDPGRPYEFEEVYPEDNEAESIEATDDVDATLIDSVTWGTETIKFWDVTNEGDEGSTILTTMLGYESDGELVYELETRAQRQVSAAEIWREATGRTDVPEILAMDHAARVNTEGLPKEYGDFSVKKQIGGTTTFNFNDMFPLTIAGTCWGRSMATPVGLSGNFPAVHACTSIDPSSQSAMTFAQLVPVTVTSNCSPSSFFGTKRGVRAGLFNRGQNNLRGQTCYATNAFGQWTCGTEFMVLPNQYLVSFFNQTSSTHRLAMGATATGVFPGSATLVGALDIAAAMLLNGITQFQSTKCGAGQGT